CRARPAAAGTGSRSCARLSGMRSSSWPASRARTGRVDPVIAIEVPRRFASLVKFEHTVFALPFAYVGAFLAVDEVPGGHDLVWITVAMVGARSLAMALNRLIDAQIDARNPRTAGRELPSGRLSVAQVGAFCALSLAVFLVAVWQLDPLVRWLWPIPVAAFVVYPYLKRVTWLAHLWLGAVDGLAPIGAWAAIRGEIPGPPGCSGARSQPGWRGSTSSTRCSTSTSTGRRGCTRGRHGGAWAASSPARAACTAPRSACSPARARACRSAACTGRASAWWLRSSPMSIG